MNCLSAEKLAERKVGGIPPLLNNRVNKSSSPVSSLSRFLTFRTKQGDKVGLYLQTRVCIQTFLDFWVCKRSVFHEKGLYSDKNGRSNDKVIITI